VSPRGPALGGPRPATYREVLAVREFRALYAAQIASLLGDQVAKVALAILVLDRSDSPLLAALAYAFSYLPWIVAGPVLSPVADRRARKAVMVNCDLVRAAAVGAMALPGMPLWLLFALLFGASALMPPFDAARAATLPDVLTGDRYVVASSLSSITVQLAQAAGFVLGGAAVVWLRPRGALVADAVSFALSAAFIAYGVKHRPAVLRDARPTLRADIVDGASVVFRSPVLRSILLLAWLGATFSIVPEGLAVTYARQLHRGPLATGFLTAAIPAGWVVGALLIGRLAAPATRLRMMRALAALAFLPLLATVLRPPVWGTVALWMLTGMAMSYQIPANATFMTVVPPDLRGRAFGLAQSGMQAFQGLSIAGAGALATVLPAHQVVAVSGALGLASVALVSTYWPVAALAALHEPPAPLPADDDLSDMTFGDIPIEQPESALPEISASATWRGPYPLVPRPRTIVGPIVSVADPAGEPAERAADQRGR
jgi:MFS family permease